MFLALTCPVIHAFQQANHPGRHDDLLKFWPILLSEASLFVFLLSLLPGRMMMILLLCHPGPDVQACPGFF